MLMREQCVYMDNNACTRTVNALFRRWIETLANHNNTVLAVGCAKRFHQLGAFHQFLPCLRFRLNSICVRDN